MPALPAGITTDGEMTPVAKPITEASAPYLRIADDLRAAIRCGALRPEDRLPTVAELAKRYQVAISTAHRAVATLAAAGLVSVSRGRPETVAVDGA